LQALGYLLHVWMSGHSPPPVAPGNHLLRLSNLLQSVETGQPVHLSANRTYNLYSLIGGHSLHSYTEQHRARHTAHSLPNRDRTGWAGRKEDEAGQVLAELGRLGQTRGF